MYEKANANKMLGQNEMYIFNPLHFETTPLSPFHTANDNTNINLTVANG